MSRYWPTAAELGCVEFVVEMPGLRQRYLLAGALFVVGLLLVMLAPGALAFVGLVTLLGGHVPLWVRSQTISPGGATPVHEEVWAPVESDWQERVAELERRGKAWDASPWDVTSVRGAAFLVVLVLALVFGLPIVFGALLGPGATTRLMMATVGLLVPLWLNGMRTTWNSSELLLKGEALAIAATAAAQVGEGRFDQVPLLALREGARGKHPVDARLMLRPTDDESGFLGVQVQVAINNVRGADYPYLYCVVLGKGAFVLPGSKEKHQRRGRSVPFVFEQGSDGEVRFLVVRQHADDSGGWHTESEHIEEAQATNRGQESG
jgi:hypothetical protein